jgi:hypothetical protein
MGPLESCDWFSDVCYYDLYGSYVFLDRGKLLGNVFEIVEDSFFGSTPFRALGGSWNRDASYAGSGYTSWNAGGNGSNEVGFRIATVPEPTTLSFLALGGLALAINKRRRA